MLRHSYKVEVKRLEATISGLNFDFARTKDPKILEIIDKKEKELSWFKERIKNDKDTGCYTL